METLVLTIHILIAFALVLVVLLHRSEGGGLGIGEGGGGGFMTARGTANLMTRITTILVVGFFTTTIILAIMAGYTTEWYQLWMKFATGAGTAIWPNRANWPIISKFFIEKCAAILPFCPCGCVGFQNTWHNLFYSCMSAF